MLQFCSVSNSLSHTTLSIKWEVYKELCRSSSLLCRCYDSACVCVWVYYMIRSLYRIEIFNLVSAFKKRYELTCRKANEWTTTHTHIHIFTHTDTHAQAYAHTDKRIGTLRHVCWKIFFCLVRFYGISTIVGYSMPNPAYAYIMDVYDLLWFVFWVFLFFFWLINHCRLFNAKSFLYIYNKYIGFGLVWFGLVWFYGISYLPTPPLGQDMTQGQFLSGV